MSKNNCPARTLYISLDFFAVPTKQQREETKFQIQITKWVDYHSLSGEGGGGGDNLFYYYYYPKVVVSHAGRMWYTSSAVL